MKLVIADGQKKLAVIDISGSEWIAANQGFANKHRINVVFTASGNPQHGWIEDYTGHVISRLTIKANVDHIERYSRAHYAPLSIIITMTGEEPELTDKIAVSRL